MLSALDNKLLKEIANMDGEPEGAFNIRKDGEGISRHSLPGIEIIPKKISRESMYWLKRTKKVRSISPLS